MKSNGEQTNNTIPVPMQSRHQSPETIEHFLFSLLHSSNWSNGVNQSLPSTPSDLLTWDTESLEAITIICGEKKTAEISTILELVWSTKTVLCKYFSCFLFLATLDTKSRREPKTKKWPKIEIGKKENAGGQVRTDAKQQLGPSECPDDRPRNKQTQTKKRLDRPFHVRRKPRKTQYNSVKRPREDEPTTATTTTTATAKKRKERTLE